jgi:hypothetical protein
MATKFHTMLAPINLPTGDGRRFKTGGIELAATPFPFEWARAREGGHDGAVVVGAVHEATITTVGEALANGWVTRDQVKGLSKDTEAVWASGVMFDDVDREEMPRLAEDVAEAMHLINNGTLGPSVDLDSFEGIAVKEGTDEEITWEMLEEAELAGEDLKVELLITAGRVRAATLVSIPAFAETPRPLTLFAEEPAEGEASNTAALIASVATERRPPATAFQAPELTEPTPITYDWDKGLVYGHIALEGTCHAGFPDVCVTVPPEDPSYSWFNRYPVETEDGGLVWAGRLTVGGRHADLSLTASGAMAEHDRKTLVAHVHASKDRFGIVVAGPLEPDLSEQTKAILSRRKVSGDWRETPGGLSLVELLALAPGPRRLSEPGFPVATHVMRGRQTALVASLGPDAELGSKARLSTAEAIEAAMERVLARREEALAERERAAAARAALAAELEPWLAKQAAEVEAARTALAELVKTGEE